MWDKSGDLSINTTSLGAAGVKLSGDGDGAFTILGLGDGSDEDLTLNLDDTANTGVYSSSTGLDTLSFGGIGLTSTGVLNFGGATSFEIPNAAGGTTVNAAGELTIDTTSESLNFYDGTEERALNPVKTMSFVVVSPATGDAFRFIKLPWNWTTTDIDCILNPERTGESAGVDIQEYDSSGDNGVSVDAEIACDNDGQADDGSLTNPAADSADWLGAVMGTVGATVTNLTVTITGFVTP